MKAPDTIYIPADEPRFSWRSIRHADTDLAYVRAELPYELAKTVEAQKAEIARLRKAVRDLDLSYVRLMEAGRDRIRDLGGDCDPIDVMERADPNLKKAREALRDCTCGFTAALTGQT